MSAAEMKARTFDWFDERLGLRIARDLLDHKVVPLHPGTAWYYFGGITLFLFGVQMFTGLLLLLYFVLLKLAETLGTRGVLEPQMAGQAAELIAAGFDKALVKPIPYSEIERLVS